MIRIARVVILILILVALPASAGAASSKPLTDETRTIRVVSAYDVLPRSGEILLGVEIKLARGWHSYWANSGDSGFPPSLDFVRQTPEITGNSTAFPAPKRFVEPGDLIAYGYNSEVLYPVRATIEAAGADSVTLRGDLVYLLCEHKCIPYTDAIELTLPVADEPVTNAADARTLEYWLARVPVEVASIPGVSAAGYLVESEGTRHLVIDVNGVTPDPSGPTLFPRTHDDFLVGNRPTVVVSETGVRFTTDLTPIEDTAPPASAFDFAVTGVRVDGEPAALAATVETTPGRAPPQVQTQAIAAPSGIGPGAGTGLALMLLLAVVGGLILNVMPCVLPVLSLKVFAVVQAAGEGRRAVVASNLATAAGILTSFWALAAAAAIARQAGLAVGWGVQFQEPLFVSALGVVVLLFALNLWGLFEIPMPAFAGKLGGGDGGEGLAGHFATGLFATLLATPCSAPFLGTAVGFSLTQSTPTILAVFTALGIGMALPYLTLAAFPRLAGYFPKPGMWMNNVRVVMGFLLAATLVWLLYGAGRADLARGAGLRRAGAGGGGVLRLDRAHPEGGDRGEEGPDRARRALAGRDGLAGQLLPRHAGREGRGLGLRTRAGVADLRRAEGAGLGRRRPDGAGQRHRRLVLYVQGGGEGRA